MSVLPEALTALGWHAGHADAFARYGAEGLVPARVAVEHRSVFELYAESGEVEAALAGSLRHRAKKRRELPAVGDWVAVSTRPGGGLGLIEAVLPRTSVFTRKVAGRESDEQIVAANIDVVFLVTSLNDEFNPRRIERYLTLAWESGASPVVVLSKLDLCADPDPLVRQAEAVAPGVPVLTTSATTGAGVEQMRARLSGHRTGALLGSSGVGKSTLINAFVGYERQKTAGIRESDDTGRHTTTWRELVQVPGGGLLIDTPGMRELQMFDADEGILGAFADIEALAAACAFGDCTHGPEPGCAVKAAVADGRMSSGRLESYLKLVAELAHLSRRDDRRAAAEKKRSDKAANKALNKRLKDKDR